MRGRAARRIQVGSAGEAVAACVEVEVKWGLIGLAASTQTTVKDALRALIIASCPTLGVPLHDEPAGHNCHAV